MFVHATPQGLVVRDGATHRLFRELGLDALLATDDPLGRIRTEWDHGTPSEAPTTLLAPIGSQELWAAGVTYFRSRVARMAESEAAGGGSFYDRVYDADRPELFFKSTAARVVGPGGRMRLRRDSRWMVPEPELALVINHAGRVVGYTVGNDLSARDIEGENPLYLPQAKMWDGSAAIGPGWLLTDQPLPPETEIILEIRRGDAIVNTDRTNLGQMRRRPDELVAYLFRETRFPNGCLMMTGTGIVPPDDFTLVAGDTVNITIPPIGTLTNRMTVAG
jgi:2-dehydro-3-deoxy-D-arabinonate dehydratase